MARGTGNKSVDRRGRLEYVRPVADMHHLPDCTMTSGWCTKGPKSVKLTHVGTETWTGPALERFLLAQARAWPDPSVGT